MKCFVGLDDTDSSAGYCTTYLAYRIAADLRDDLRVLPYPRLVRLNPNIPFKTRGNAAVCLSIETADSERAFRRICSKVSELSDVDGGANSGVVFLDDLGSIKPFEGLYLDALCGLVNVHRVEKLLREFGVRTMTLGNGMGLVGAASSLGFDERFDHTYELISYRLKEFWGKPRAVDAQSVKEMDRLTYPRTFNNYDYQKRKVLIAPHGPDPVFVGIRGDSPETVVSAFEMIRKGEELDGHMVYLSNQHTEAHLARELDWKVFSSGWVVGNVEDLEVGQGGHLYFTLRTGDKRRHCAVYEPTGDLRRAAKLLRQGDEVKAYGGVRRATSLHPKVLNVERIDVLSLASDRGERTLVTGSYVASPRANRHLSKPLIRYGNEVAGKPSKAVADWLRFNSVIPTPALARSP
ncbi:MAG: tRNA(Ile)(2)-agmatinylcytidine synthase [Nitrososphaerales archaeon]|nr:tRNA(Ile)(2)-agmatinylcytidine synthase [Nitrososphaerales archaeon]